MYVISGASGLVGSALQKFWSEAGKDVKALVRREPKVNQIAWSPSAATIDSEGLAGAKVVVHLAGESVVGRWSDDKKKRILDSRVNGTRLIAESLADMADKPEVLICASAVGYYPDSEESFDESAAPATDFLADVCVKWEAAADAARTAGIRVVHLRIGLVMSKEGGALGSMLTPFKMGLGGKTASGRQWMSWITRRDLVRMIDWAAHHPSVEGPVNAVTPNPVRNLAFTKALGAALGRPTVFTVPKFALKAALGEFSKELLVSHRIEPGVALAEGFVFEDPEIQKALQRVLKSA